MTHEEASEIYSAICDVIERTRQGWPLDDEDEMHHTSTHARAAALRIFDILGIDMPVPPGFSDSVWLRRVAECLESQSHE